MKITLLLLCTLAQVMAFAPNSVVPKSRSSVAFRSVETPRFLSPTDESSADDGNESASLASRSSAASVAAAGLASALFAFVPTAMAVTEEIEMAELPPPFIPVLFSIGLLVGVAVLTGTLGDVIDQEAMLGMQSGARAKKDIERSRSSYFKK
jgi:hypothetical protein